MKRLTKTRLILLIITITFLSGINKVGAAVTCEYSLPYSGINVATGDYIKVDDDFKCNATDEKSKNCAVYARISTSGFEFDECKDGAANSYDVIWIKPLNYYRMWGVDSDGRLLYNSIYEGSKEYTDTTLTSDSCPQFIEISTNVYSNTSADYLKALMKKAYKSASGCGLKKNKPHFYLTGWSNYEIGSKYVNLYNIRNDYKSYQYHYYSTPGDSYYKDSLSNTYNVSTASELNKLDKIILPLYNGKQSLDVDKDTETAIDSVTTYRDIVGTAWTNQLNKQRTNLNNSCGREYEKYINYKNYKNSFKTSNDFVNYASVYYDTINVFNTSDKSAIAGADSDITESCWNARTDFMNMYKSFKIFMYNIGVTTKGQTENNDNPYFKAFYNDTTSDYDNNKVFDWKMMNYFFTAVRWGTDQKLETFTSDNKEVNERVEKTKEVSRAQVVKDTFYSDKCAYICFDGTNVENLSKDNFKNQYTTCQNHNESYSTCKTAIKDCQGSSSCNYTSGVAQTECQKAYESKLSSDGFNSCMDSKVANFSTLSSQAYENAKSKYDEALKAYNEQSWSFGFVQADLPSINYNFAKYEPKCSDVVIFTDIWQAMRIIAPFLMIIFGSIDYFKAVIASDMEAMKKAKSKFPKRLIAFILLIIIPFLLSIIMKMGTNGAENTTYFRCIVTGNKGGTK